MNLGAARSSEFEIWAAMAGAPLKASVGAQAFRGRGGGGGGFDDDSGDDSDDDGDSD